MLEITPHGLVKQSGVRRVTLPAAPYALWGFS